jgi:hypothetical protein
MNAEIAITGASVIGLVLSSTLLLRARRLSDKLWSARPSSQRTPAGNVMRPAERD